MPYEYYRTGTPTKLLCGQTADVPSLWKVDSI